MKRILATSAVALLVTLGCNTSPPSGPPGEQSTAAASQCSDRSERGAGLLA